MTSFPTELENLVKRQRAAAYAEKVAYSTYLRCGRIASAAMAAVVAGADPSLVDDALDFEEARQRGWKRAQRDLRVANADLRRARLDVEDLHHAA